jgi:tellurite methyltransferase
MRRLITGYHLDDTDEWVAELSCGHGQHVRHHPPFQLREWVLDADGRARRLGTPLDCPWCDRTELPECAEFVRSSPEWDENTIPAGLRRAHRLAADTWGRITVRRGALRFIAQTEPALDTVLGAGSTHVIPPEVSHEVHPLGSVCFSIDFLSVRQARAEMSTRPAPESAEGTIRAQGDDKAGGESACFAHLLCSDCGAVLDGGGHVAGCRATVTQ